MAILVRKSGVFDTFQDNGRRGHRRSGINPNGAMDRTALRLVNAVLDNDEFEAALEMHFPAPELEFRRRISFALAGADFSCRLDGNTVEVGRCLTAEPGSILDFAQFRAGKRCYLAVKNGFRLSEWLASNSTNLLAGVGGFEGRRLRKGDRIQFKEADIISRPVTAGFPRISNQPTELRYVPGPDFESITALSELDFRKGEYVISGDSDRMGYRLNGPSVHLLDSSDRLSASVTFGTIQVLPGGSLILLMADHQTTGGYPNIGTVMEPDLPLAAQLGAGARIRFKPVSVGAAERAVFSYEREFSFLKTGLRLSSNYFKHGR